VLGFFDDDARRTAYKKARAWFDENRKEKLRVLTDNVLTASPRLKMYFDKQTHLLVKLGGKTYSDYKRFDGVPIPQKEQDGYLNPTLVDFRAVDNFDANLFERP
jgi:hypothetical protein